MIVGLSLKILCGSVAYIVSHAVVGIEDWIHVHCAGEGLGGLL